MRYSEIIEGDLPNADPKKWAEKQERNRKKQKRINDLQAKGRERNADAQRQINDIRSTIEGAASAAAVPIEVGGAQSPSTDTSATGRRGK